MGEGRSENSVTEELAPHQKHRDFMYDPEVSDSAVMIDRRDLF